MSASSEMGWAGISRVLVCSGVSLAQSRGTQAVLLVVQRDGEGECLSVSPCNPCFARQTRREELALAAVTEDIFGAVRPCAPCLWERGWGGG